MNDQYAGWDWVVRCYYAADVAPPKQPRALAIETVHRGTASRDIEVRAARARPDIGDVVWMSAAAARVTPAERQ